jgi:hypothetical protein
MTNDIINHGTIVSPIPVGAYGSMPLSGNEYSSPSMFLQPTIVSPGFQPNPGIDYAGGMAQPFTPFINGEPWQPPMPSTNTSILDHPCQGKGGSGCGCGGNCVGSVVSQEHEAVGSQEPQKKKLANQEEINRLISLINPEVFQKQVLKNTPGNTSLMTATFPDGQHITSFAKVLSDGSIVLETKEITKNRSLLSITFPILDNGKGWTININGNIRSNLVTSVNTPLDAFSYLGLIASLGTEMLDSKLARMQSKAMPLGTPPPCAEPGTLCTDHDMKCSPFSGESWPWTSDHMHVKFWALCVGSYTTDIGDCCKEHDRAMWCSHDPIELTKANDTVIRCISMKVIAEGKRQLEDIIKDLPFPADVIWGVICGAAFLIWEAASNIFLDGVMEGVYAGYVAYITRGNDRNFVNFHGENDQSCLCGGTQPTILCGDQNCCRDLCKEFPHTHPREDCMDCGCVCDYDAQGRFVGTHFRNPNGPPLIPGDPFDDTGCCPGTGFPCNGLNQNNPCTGFDTNCPRCSWCEYECTFLTDPKTHFPIRDPRTGHLIPYKKLLKSHEQLPCCKAPEEITCLSPF